MYKMYKFNNNLIFNLNPYYGLISISGPDAFTFLQGQVTCDIKQINKKNTLFGAYCNQKGRIRALFRIFIKENRYLLFLPLAILPKTLETLKKYARFSKVIIQDESFVWSYIGITGPNALKSINRFSGNELINILPLAIKDDNFNRFILMGPEQLLSPLIDSALNLTESINLNENKIYLGDFETWKYYDIITLHPEIWPETIEKLLPHDINLLHLDAISFTKGCYCGQEIIARMEYRGKVKKHLIHKTIENYDNKNTLMPGTEFENGIIVTTSQINNKMELLMQVEIL